MLVNRSPKWPIVAPITDFFLTPIPSHKGGGGGGSLRLITFRISPTDSNESYSLRAALIDLTDFDLKFNQESMFFFFILTSQSHISYSRYIVKGSLNDQ